MSYHQETVFESWRKVCRKTIIYIPNEHNDVVKQEIPDLHFIMTFSFIHCPHAKAQAEVQSVPSATPTVLALTYFNICSWFFIKFLHKYKNQTGFSQITPFLKQFRDINQTHLGWISQIVRMEVTENLSKQS